MMKFIKLTFASNHPFFVQPEMIISFGPSSLDALSDHRAWICIQGDRNEIFVKETCEEISHLLELRQRSSG